MGVTYNTVPHHLKSITDIFTTAKMFTAIILLSLLWSLVEVHSQPEYPHVSFMGETLPNHSYVDLSLVGDPESGGDSVQCFTDLATCCSSAQNNPDQYHRGDWYFPDGRRLPFASDSTADIHAQREAQRVELRRRSNALSPSSIYRCDMPTIAVHGDDFSSEREIVYVGLYGSGGIGTACVMYNY